jgi:Mg2+/Co2+ transporter CorC
MNNNTTSYMMTNSNIHNHSELQSIQRTLEDKKKQRIELEQKMELFNEYFNNELKNQLEQRESLLQLLIDTKHTQLILQEAKLQIDSVKDMRTY